MGALTEFVFVEAMGGWAIDEHACPECSRVVNDADIICVVKKTGAWVCSRCDDAWGAWATPAQ